jgi:hypothetical protein
MPRNGFDHGFTDSQWQGAKAEATAVLRERAARRSNQTIAYSELVECIKAVTLEPHDTRLAHMLGEISSDEDAARRGMLTVLVVHKGDVRPGDGFFELARSLGRDVRDREKVWITEFNRVIDYYKK